MPQLHASVLSPESRLRLPLRAQRFIHIKDASRLQPPTFLRHAPPTDLIDKNEYIDPDHGPRAAHTSFEDTDPCPSSNTNYAAINLARHLRSGSLTSRLASLRLYTCLSHSLLLPTTRTKLPSSALPCVTPLTFSSRDQVRGASADVFSSSTNGQPSLQ
jgi:hypothetical protein